MQKAHHLTSPIGRLLRVCADYRYIDDRKIISNEIIKRSGRRVGSARDLIRSLHSSDC